MQRARWQRLAGARQRGNRGGNLGGGIRRSLRLRGAMGRRSCVRSPPCLSVRMLVLLWIPALYYVGLDREDLGEIQSDILFTPAGACEVRVLVVG